MHLGLFVFSFITLRVINVRSLSSCSDEWRRYLRHTHNSGTQFITVVGLTFLKTFIKVTHMYIKAGVGSLFLKSLH